MEGIGALNFRQKIVGGANEIGQLQINGAEKSRLNLMTKYFFHKINY